MMDVHIVPAIPQDLDFWLHGLPYETSQLVRHTLENEHTTPDHVLLMADGLQKIARSGNVTADASAAFQATANHLRDFAPRFDSPRVEQEVFNAINA